MFIAWRELSYAKGRFALLGGVIALMTLMVVLLTGLTAGLGAASVSAVTALPPGDLVFQEPAAGQKTDFATSALPPATVTALGGDPIGVSTTRMNHGDATDAVTVLGADAALYPAIEKGTAPGPGQAAVTSGLTAAIGDTVTLGGHDYTVTAIVADVTFNHLPVVYVPFTDWQALARTDTASAVLVDGTAPDVPGTVAADRDTAYAAVGGYSSEQGSLTLMRVLLLGVSVLIVGAFFTVWTMQRAGDLAVVRAIGGGRGYLLRDALGQALAVLLAGAAVGGGAAAGLGALAARAVPFVLDVSTVALPVAAMVGVGLLGAAVCVRRTTTVDPLTALGAAR